MWLCKSRFANKALFSDELNLNEFPAIIKKTVFRLRYKKIHSLHREDNNETEKTGKSRFAGVGAGAGVYGNVRFLWPAGLIPIKAPSSLARLQLLNILIVCLRRLNPRRLDGISI
jgi:hypothetical protein